MTKMSYRRWMQEVDRIVEDTCGLPTSLLPDWLSRDAFDQGCTPKEGAEMCLEEAGYGKVSSTLYAATEDAERLYDEP